MHNLSNSLHKDGNDFCNHPFAWIVYRLFGMICSFFVLFFCFFSGGYMIFVFFGHFHLITELRWSSAYFRPRHPPWIPKKCPLVRFSVPNLSLEISHSNLSYLFVQNLYLNVCCFILQFVCHKTQSEKQFRQFREKVIISFYVINQIGRHLIKHIQMHLWS